MLMVRSRQVLEKRKKWVIGFYAKSPGKGKSFMKDITSEWVDKAEEDFYSADLLLHAMRSQSRIPPVFIASNARKNISRLIYRNMTWSLNAAMN